MRKLFVIAATALLFASSTSAAFAQGRGEGRGRGDDRRYERSERGRGGDYRDRDRGPPPQRQMYRDRGDDRRMPQGRMPERRMEGRPMPGPQRGWERGQYLPPSSRGGQIQDPSRYRLRSPPSGYDWVQVGPDIYLTQRSTGLVVEAIPRGF